MMGDTTHSADCYKWHHECAKRQVEDLRAEVKRLKGQLDRCLPTTLLHEKVDLEEKNLNLRAALSEKEAALERLREAVEWACENGNYNPQIQPGDCLDKLNYANNEWWKAELRRRAGMEG